MQIVVIGASLGGLAAALRLGRSGHEVVVLDRDPAPPDNVGDAFARWQRRGVTQWRQYHVFRARARIELERSMPDVLERLREIGVAPLSSDEFAGLPVRRPVLEWILRREVDRNSRIDVRANSAAVSLLLDDRRRRVTGVRTFRGCEISADLVIDAGGRRSPVDGWLSDAGYDCPPETRSSCRIAYYTRYYEAVRDTHQPMLDRSGVELFDDGFMAHALAVGDSGTLGAIFVVPASAPEFRALSTIDGWDAAVRFIPRLSEVLDARARRPIMAPATMYGLDNVLSPWHADGIRGPRGIARIGDTWLVTNPNLAWGSSIALAHAATLADALDDHGPSADDAIDDYHQRTRSEVEQLFTMACDTDRALQRRWGLSTERPSMQQLERESLLFAFARLAKHGNAVAAEHLARRMNLLELPDEVWGDDDLIRGAREELERVPYDPNRKAVGLDRDEFLTSINQLSPAGSVASAM